MDEILDTKQAAAYIKHSVITLEQWRSQNKGPTWYQPASKVLYYRSDLDDWVKTQGESK